MIVLHQYVTHDVKDWKVTTKKL